MHIRFLWGEVETVDEKERSLRVVSPLRKHPVYVNFDYLIVASGSQYGIYMDMVKDPSSAAECLWYPTFLKKQREEEVSEWGYLDERFTAARRTHFEDEVDVLKELNEKEKAVVVVGAGFVGVEWATELKHYYPKIKVVLVEKRDKPVGAMPPRCIKYVQRYMDRVGIISIYGFDYELLRKQESFEKMDLAKYGITPADIERVYMAVGVRSINNFLPDSCRTEITRNRETGEVTRGGWAQCNKYCQVMNGEKLLLDGRVFAAGNCAEVEGWGNTLPKNSAPGEDMACVAAHNIEALEAKNNPKFGKGCLCFCKPPKKMKEMYWGFGTGICMTSLGPHDATGVFFGTKDPGSGYTLMTGRLAAMMKEFVRWSKVDQEKYGCMGRLIWSVFH